MQGLGDSVPGAGTGFFWVEGRWTELDPGGGRRGLGTLLVPKPCS